MSMVENEQIVRELVERAFNQGDYTVLKSHVKPDFVEHQFGLHATLDGMQADIEYLRTAFPDFNLTIDDAVVDGDKVWLRMTARGTNLGGFMGAPNGKSFKVAVFDLIRLADGKLVEHWGSPDRFALMAQLGLLPQPTAA